VASPRKGGGPYPNGVARGIVGDTARILPGGGADTRHGAPHRLPVVLGRHAAVACGPAAQSSLGSLRPLGSPGGAPGRERPPGHPCGDQGEGPRHCPAHRKRGDNAQAAEGNEEADECADRGCEQHGDNSSLRAQHDHRVALQYKLLRGCAAILMARAEKLKTAQAEAQCAEPGPVASVDEPMEPPTPQRGGVAPGACGRG
jgi:hypothetical protein